MRKWIALWFASLVAVAMLTSAAMLAQGERLLPKDYRMITGDNIGFRIEGSDLSGHPIGRFMLRVNGEWVEIGSAPGPRPAS